MPSPLYQGIANVLQLTFYAGLACAFFGLHQYLPPPIGNLVSENKGQAVMFLFVLNIVATQLLATGAFEFYLGEKLIFSKLETGRPPRLPELLKILEQNL
eukprot:TRINITY_DN9938_c0_g2_i1.p1 TRINITY_DN9938_c0_g2~~TRINITY_DN9938_c0_g2_i1.p1  ORF type:complete len:100 (+),score=16.82 TRINITY_DN9938_c0_g2_i1:376-675(+)